jgi:hypothetical protein
VRGPLVDPGAIGPVSKLPPSPVAVWTSVSALRHWKRCPTRTLVEAGANDLDPSIPLIVIVMTEAGVGEGEGVAVGMGVGVGKGVGVGRGVGVGNGVGVGKGVGVAPGIGVAVGDGEGDGVGVAPGVGVGPGVGLGEVDGLGEGGAGSDWPGMTGDGAGPGRGGVSRGVGDGLGVGSGPGGGVGDGVAAVGVVPLQLANGSAVTPAKTTNTAIEENGRRKDMTISSKSDKVGSPVVVFARLVPELGWKVFQTRQARPATSPFT